MSAAAAATTTDVAVPIKAGKRKKLFLIGAVALLVLLLAGAATALWLKNRAAHALDDAGDDEVALQFKGAKPDPAHPPTFLPLDIFVVNLADKDAERYAQVGITLEVDSAPFADQMKAYMPAIRNAVLMILAHKTSHELLERAGKERLAEEIMRETVRPLGISVQAPAARKPAAAPVDGSLTEVPAKKAKAAQQGPHNPVRSVHFSNFIIQ